MPIVRAQVSVPMVSTVTEDTITNTWHFTATSTSEGVLAEIKAALVDFYEDMDNHKGDNALWTSARVKLFDLSETPPRVPIDDAGLTLSTPPTNTPVPHEVSAVLSFHGEYVSGASQARRRGRIYFGPISTGSIDTTTGQLSAGIVSALATAGGALLTTSNTASDWAWVVYSPTAGTGYPVVGGWADNAPDVQRRRGLKATTRTTF